MRIGNPVRFHNGYENINIIGYLHKQVESSFTKTVWQINHMGDIYTRSFFDLLSDFAVDDQVVTPSGVGVLESFRIDQKSWKVKLASGHNILVCEKDLQLVGNLAIGDRVRTFGLLGVIEGKSAFENCWWVKIDGHHDLSHVSEKNLVKIEQKYSLLIEETKEITWSELVAQ